MNRYRTLAALVCCCPATLLAHPGHGTTEPETISHYALEPIHLLPVAVLIAATGIVWGLRYWNRSR